MVIALIPCYGTRVAGISRGTSVRRRTRKFELLCDDVIAGSSLYDCHPHPHNFYLQMLGEAGIIGCLTGVLFLGSVIWACTRPALQDRSHVVVATMWIVPFSFFWPIASTADFFGQWNNIFMWSAVAVALAGAQINSQPATHKDPITLRSASVSSLDSIQPKDRSGLQHPY